MGGPEQLHDHLRQRQPDGQAGGADDHGEQREQDLRPDGDVRRYRVHDERPGQRRHGHGRDRDEHRAGGDSDGGRLAVRHRAQRGGWSGLGNYTITYVNGTLTVNPAALTITANNTSKTYGQTATFTGTAFTDERPGQRRHDHGCDRDQHRAVATATVVGSPYAIVPSAAVGTGLGNYTITYVNGA